MAEWSNIQRAFLAGARYGYKRGYQDAEAETRREVEGLMAEMPAENRRNAPAPRATQVDEEADTSERDSPKTPLN